MNPRPVIYVIDDDTAVRDSLAELGRMMGCTVRCHESAMEFLNSVDSYETGCIILDIRMPGMSGLELQETLSQRRCHLPIIIVTGHGDVPMCVSAIKAGAVDFLEKPYSPEELVHSIRNALDLDTRQRVEKQERNAIRTQISLLSSGERQVLRGVADGKTNKRIADELDISLRTVQLRRASIKKKLSIDSKSEMVQLVRRALVANVGAFEVEKCVAQ